MLYGPNTNLGHNSIVDMLESQIRYVLEAIEELRRRGARYLDVRPEVQRAYNDEMQERLADRVWDRGLLELVPHRVRQGGQQLAGLTSEYDRRTRRARPRRLRADRRGGAGRPVRATAAARPGWVRAAVRTLVRPVLHPGVPVRFQRRWLELVTRATPLPPGRRRARRAPWAVVPVAVGSGRRTRRPDAPCCTCTAADSRVGSPATHRALAAHLAVATGARCTAGLPAGAGTPLPGRGRRRPRGLAGGRSPSAPTRRTRR